MGLHAHVVPGFDHGIGVDRCSRSAIEYRYIHTRRDTDCAKAGAGRQRDMMEIVARANHDRLRSIRIGLILVHLCAVADVGVGMRGNYVDRGGNRDPHRAAGQCGGIGFDIVAAGCGNRHPANLDLLRGKNAITRL